MSRKIKLYIPLTSINSRGITLVNVENVKGLTEVLPAPQKIANNLILQKDRMAEGKLYSPIQVEIPREQFDEFAKDFKRKKARHFFTKRVFDIIMDSKTSIPVVQIISE